MSENCNHNCGSCGENCENRKNTFLKEAHPESSIKHVIGVVSGKGGVGKSSITSLLATLFQEMGYHTAVLDADITGPSIPQGFGIHEQATMVEGAMYPVYTSNGTQIMSINMLLEEETSPVVWRGPVVSGVVQQFWTDVVWKDVDYMFVDMPPGTGDVPLTVMQSLPIDGIVVVTSPQQLVSMVVEKAVNMADMMHIPVLGIVQNFSYFVCDNCDKKHYIFGDSHVEEVADTHGIENVAVLPFDMELAAAFDAGSIEFLDSIAKEELKKEFVGKIEAAVL